MNSKQLAAIVNDLVEGSPELQRQAVNEHKPRLQQDLARLKEEAEQQKAEYKAYLQSWAGRYVEGQPRPAALPQDLRKARLAQMGAWLLAAVHLALDALVAIAMLMNPLVFVLFGLVLIFSAKAGMLFCFDDPRPQRVRRRVVHYVLVPSCVAILLSVMVLYLSRSVVGAIAMLLLGLTNVALGCLSLSALGLSSALFLLAHLYSWSKSAAQTYRALEAEAVETRRVLELALSVERGLQAALPPVAKPVVVTMTKPALGTEPVEFVPLDSREIKRAVKLNGQARCHWLSVLLACVCALVLSGCGGGTASLLKQGQPAQPAPPPVTATPVAAPQASAPVEGVWVEVLLDWSLSEAAQPLAEAAQKLAAGLPQVIELLQAVRFAAYQFGDNGWEARELITRDFPALGQAQATGGTLLFTGMQTAQQTAALTAYRQAVRAQLSGITAAAFLPPADAPEPRCTDIQGTLRRIAESGSTRPELAILVTDFAETCAAKLTPISGSRTALVVVLLPERAEEAKAVPGHDQFAQRRAEVERVYPGAVVIAHFGELPPAVKKAWQVMAQATDARN